MTRDYTALFIHTDLLTEEVTKNLRKVTGNGKIFYTSFTSLSHMSKRAWDATDWIILNDWLKNLWPELHESGSYQVAVSYFEPTKLTDFYERRQLALERYLENNSQTGKEKEYLPHIDEKVSRPFYYEWIQGWQNLLSKTIDLSTNAMALFLAIVLSALFAGE